MASLNKTFLMGNLTRDPELRHTGQGTPVCSLGLAVNRSYKQGDEWKKEVQFFNVTVWNKQGENCAKYLSKGRPVLVEGRLQNRSYDAQDGSKRTVTEIVADNIQFLGSGNGESSNNGNAIKDAQETFGADVDENIPF